MSSSAGNIWSSVPSPIPPPPPLPPPLLLQSEYDKERHAADMEYLRKVREARHNKKNKLTPEEIQEKKDREEWAEREDELIEKAKKGIILPGRTSPIPIPKPNDSSYPFRGGRLRRSRRSKTVSGKRSAKTKKRKTRARRGRTRRGRKCNCKNKCKCIRNTRKSRKR